MIEIRIAKPEEAGAIVEVLREAFGLFEKEYTPESFAIVTPDADEIVARFNKGPQWIAVKDSEIVGTVSAVPEPEWLYIQSLAVRPSAQGLGVAHKLLDAVEQYAVDNGFDRLFLYTTYFSTGAIELYEKHGFVRGRDTTAEEWYGTPGLEMDKKLERN